MKSIISSQKEMAAVYIKVGVVGEEAAASETKTDAAAVLKSAGNV